MFIQRYLIWFKVIGAIAVALMIWWAWGHFVAEPYRDQGRAEIQAKWDKRERELALQYADSVKKALQDQQDRYNRQSAAASQRVKDIEHEKTALQASLDTERNANRRLRTITGTIVAAKDPMPSVRDAVNRGDATCEARLPATLGTAFQRLREGALRIGSEANEVAINLGESQETHRINSGK